MQVVTSKKVQSNFGEVADIAKFGTPVTITQYGRPTLMLMRFQDGVAAMKELAKQDMAVWLDNRAKIAPAAALEITDVDLNTLISQAFAK